MANVNSKTFGNVVVYETEWRSFLEVQKSGNHNMMSPAARVEGGCDKETWFAMLSNYETLEKEWGNNETE